MAIQGLSSAEAEQRLREYGPNQIEEKKSSLLERLIGWIATPMSLMFAAAGGLSIFAGNDTDAAIIVVLFLINVGVGAYHEAKADTAIEKLKEKLSVTVKVLRNSSWTRLPSLELVPDDTIELATGDLVPADVLFVSTKNVSVNESTITGESLPKTKTNGQIGYSGSFIATGLATAKVTATGSHTYFGKTLKIVEDEHHQSHLEKDILSISKFLAIVSIVVMALLSVVLVIAKQPILEIATLDVSMLIAGIPVTLPTVMTLIISVGVVELAKRSIIIRRLSSLEDLSNVNLLLSDKTGTLTENIINVSKMVPLSIDYKEQYIWSLALAASPSMDNNPLDAAIHSYAEKNNIPSLPAEDFIPGDSERKRSTVFLKKNNHRIAISFGASETIKTLCDMDEKLRAVYDQSVMTAAKDGFRVLVLAEGGTDKEEHMTPLAIFYLADIVRPEARETIDFMHDYGIDVKMVTGDDHAVAEHVAGELGLSGQIVRRAELEKDSESIKQRFTTIAGFAEVMPKDKYDIVTMAHHTTIPYVVAATGDGVNDVPPIKTADVGIAVANAVDVLKGTADIVLTKAGISVIKDAIIEARKIFVRLYNYSVYRISESFRLIISIAVIGVLFHTFPLTPVQIILIALLNDVPIISLAFDRVAVSRSPDSINVRRRLILSLLFGTTGIANSLFLLWIAMSVFHAPWIIIQTMFFLKLTVSGHMLVYIAHTEERWYKFLPSKQVIWATSITQAIATALALFGIFVAKIPWEYVIFVWVWSFIWMQIGEVVKQIFFGLSAKPKLVVAKA